MSKKKKAKRRKMLESEAFVAEPKWWVIHEDEMRRMLHRVEDGEEPELVLMEEYANSEVNDA